MVAKPDPSTFQVLPWETASGEHYSARMFCDIAMPDGSPSWADPRHVLTRALNKAGEAGFTCYVHPEIEFYLLREIKSDGTPPIAADSGGYFDQSSHDVAPHFRRNAIETLESMGISVEFSHHEGGPGQQEIDLRYADALTMSRIGPVYTPPEHRNRGYAAAVTSAAARWALDHGARHVAIFTDLDNPTTNRLYPRLGFRPRYDALELHFVPGASDVIRAKAALGKSD